MTVRQPRVLLLGCGDVGTGVAHTLFRAGLPVAILELERPLAVRRRVAFAQAARDGSVQVEGVRCVRVSLDELASQPPADTVRLVVAPLDRVLEVYRPEVLVDARLAKRPLKPRPPRSIFFVSLGPGAVVERDCDVAVETLRGPGLGRLIHGGSAAADTGIPGKVGGATATRVLRAPRRGVVRVHADIGTHVRLGDVVAEVDGAAVRAALDGVVRGMLSDGDAVVEGQKLGDVDPRPDAPPLDAISDKARCIGESVLRAVRARFGLVGA